MFVKWILKYYGLNDTENLTITSMVEDLNNTYAGKVLVSTDAIHEELESHFLRFCRSNPAVFASKSANASGVQNRSLTSRKTIHPRFAGAHKQ